MSDEKMTNVYVVRDEYWGPVALAPVEKVSEEYGRAGGISVPESLVEQFDAAWAEVDRVVALIEKYEEERA